MPKIRYVCLSDMHFGEEDSLLTNLARGSADIDPTAPSPVVERLVDCLRHVVGPLGSRAKEDRPTLVLLGDILELALARDNDAAMAFERFIELVLPRDEGERLFKEIVYVPGNHDHHIWESARETQYAEMIQKIRPPGRLPTPPHSTPLFVEKEEDRVTAYFPTRLLRRHEHLVRAGADGSPRDEVPIWAAYPNFGLRSEDGGRCVLFHHGHYVESLYHLMSTVKTLLFPNTRIPTTADALECENFAWIDFFWSVMGRSGEVARGIEDVYERLSDERATKRLIDDLAGELARRYEPLGLGDAMEERVLRLVLHRAGDRVLAQERLAAGELLGPDAEAGLKRYLTEPMKEQLVRELGGQMPTDVTFVFGHTHKPFEEARAFDGYPRWVNVYNTGGWVVDTVTAKELHGGAVVLVDDELNTASLRMYNESDDPDDYAVRVRSAAHPGEPRNPLHRELEALLARDREPWAAFSAATAEAIAARQENLRARLDKIR